MDRLLDYEERWTSVSDMLPSGEWNINHTHLSEEVLIANSCSINIGYYNREDGNWYVDAPAKQEWIDKITHWMPLPQNPHDEVVRYDTKTLKAVGAWLEGNYRGFATSQESVFIFDVSHRDIDQLKQGKMP